MPKFKIKSGGSKSGWVAEGTNPKTGRPMTIRGGSPEHRGKWGTQGGKSKEQVKSFLARHGEPDTAKQFVNVKNWKDKNGNTLPRIINIPSKFFNK